MGRRERSPSHLREAVYVAEIIPVGFPAYARIFHPAEERASDGTWVKVRWRDVARRCGRVPHAEMQWHAILDAWPHPEFDDPWEGQLPEEETRVLVELLWPFTATPEDCWFAVWDGWGDPVPLVRAGHHPGFLPVRESWPPKHDVRLACPDPQRAFRVYYLYRGPIEAAIDLSCHRRGASLWWPGDRTWCVATEVDFSWTYVAGPEALIQAILADDRLESYRATPDDRADVWGDRINQPRP